MMGKTLEILVDGYDEEFEQFYGRTYADSPDIDGRECGSRLKSLLPKENL